ncbi:helix-turn-helix domain-containing protein [Corynebacterium uropygiale]|uniref:Helix-turn-helix domain-containing protein n=1 Tax=Corynebacterium uropygiale TaxID=1775911 RepID=A0A9X1QV51_9CORY|nr:helix-turn-helix domain-containing protein [Corynebacterium uropygiale]MCF4007575.1 helix-turn-helix domain-containing protein [Corynebacterium uropygiale]
MMQTPGKVDMPVFSEFVRSSVVPLAIFPRSAEPFSGSVKRQDVGRTTFILIEASPHAVRRTQDLISDSEEGKIKVTVVLEGTSVLQQDGRTAYFNEGDIAIYDTARPYDISFPTSCRILIVMVPKKDARIPRDILDNLTAITLTKGGGLSSVVSAFFSELAKNFDELETRTGGQLADMSVAILRPILLATAEGEGYSLDRNSQLIRSVHSFIEAHLGDPDLNPATVAKAHFISLRQLYAVFSSSEASVAATIKRKRLDKAYSMIHDQTFDDISISTIATRCGIPDAAHFSRVFKERFGVSPRVARRAVRDAARR